MKEVKRKIEGNKIQCLLWGVTNEEEELHKIDIVLWTHTGVCETMG